MTPPTSESSAFVTVSARVLSDRLTPHEAAALIAARLVRGDVLTPADVQQLCGYDAEYSALRLLHSLKRVLPELVAYDLPSTGGRPRRAWHLAPGGFN